MYHASSGSDKFQALLKFHLRVLKLFQKATDILVKSYGKTRFVTQENPIICRGFQNNSHDFTCCLVRAWHMISQKLRMSENIVLRN
jgi:hypothetical protein